MAPCYRNGDDQSMSGQHSEETADDEQGSGGHEHEHSDADIKLSDEGRKEVHDMVEAYEDKPTVVLPGSHGTITGTAINEWLDDEGNPKFGDPDEHPFVEDRDETGSKGSEETSGHGP